ncbi:helix-turn-helix domain-containing protein [Rhodospirillum sp. A1_3_36]|uniref:AraC family transcriptional regulator n=1 Tax=Rhodospirillum sp. A1_3_36 TaxID=3391666 RepID=UPI0039A40B6C
MMQALAPQGFRYGARTFQDIAFHEAAIPGWQQHYVQLSPGPFEGRLDILRFPGMTVVRERMNVAVEVMETAPGDMLTYFCIPSRSGVYRGELDLTGGSFGLGSSWSYHGVCPEGSDVLMVMVDRSRVPRLALPERGALKCGHNPVDVRDMVDWLMSLMAFYERGGRQTQGEGDEDGNGLDGLLPELILDRIGAHELHTDWIGQREDRSGKVVRLSRDWLGDRPGELATVSGIANDLNLDASDLRQAWKAVFGASLDKILVARRLDGARRNIIESVESGRRISDIALDWGFFHWGRFSGRYREFFGETPTETKRRYAGRVGDQEGLRAVP